MTKDMTRGTPWKLIVQFALPIMAGNLLQQLYNTADTIIVGNFNSQQALSAVGSCASLTALFTALAIGFSIGAGVLISQYFGANRLEDLRRWLGKQAGDGSGLIYGMGHAVYTISDPREVILKQRARHLAYDKGFEEEYNMLCSIERLAPGIFAEEKGSTKPVCANVDLFSGLIYNMLGISEDIYTPLFAIARVPGWCAHRVEEVVFANRIIRPAYKYLGVRQKYKPIEER